MTAAELSAALASFPSLPLIHAPTLVEPMPRLSAILGGGPSLFVKRDDAIPFGFGGNKIRKLALVAARAKADGADMLITAGGVQSNHARATAATAARLGMHAVLVANGEAQPRPTANALLDRLLGAEVVYVPTRADRQPKIADLANHYRAEGRRPFAIPVGASTPLGALAFAAALVELVHQMAPPDVIVHSTSSGGTQAGLVAGCRLLGLSTRVIGISADEAAPALQAEVRAIISGVADLLRLDPASLVRGSAIEVDDRFVGGGYGVPTDASREAIELAARTEALFLDPTYTAKAMAGLIAFVRQQKLAQGQTVVFWHTGGQVGLFA
ncbi:MAG TPA: D-cysteine desulfhydrase family protein [Vicinamibacterales bacterium]|nr:D-cysteine desulfhydrase family protein [Vicinamibacterales bacterium]